MQQNLTLKKMIITALMVAILVILGLFPGIPLGIIPVPIVLQNMGVLLAATLLGARWGTTAVGLFLILVASGLPFLSGGHGGIAVFVGPTGGYLIGWLLAPLAIGYGNQLGRSQQTWWKELIVVLVAGVAVIDFCGSLGLSWQARIPLTSALWSNLIFIPGDIIKTLVAVFLARRLRKIKRFV
ncbi:biotin transporter BioY [Lactobacillus sp. DCY120]|uniref:Biotin transporter n=1 Tax=Bombilactobacillus apium TaxID=2675299 RepID=A0A850R4P1_9LACO|nr:biotin transporter BioY [Bombilactobacillus apium]NVY96941.1 biotin transporter BioY [Bombilactobacillus apium]